jgi:hypothetical protein
MSRSPAEIHDRVRLRLDEMISTAMRVDSAAIAAIAESTDRSANLVGRAGHGN